MRLGSQMMWCWYFLTNVFPLYCRPLYDRPERKINIYGTLCHYDVFSFNSTNVFLVIAKLISMLYVDEQMTPNWYRHFLLCKVFEKAPPSMRFHVLICTEPCVMMVLILWVMLRYLNQVNYRKIKSSKNAIVFLGQCKLISYYYVRKFIQFIFILIWHIMFPRKFLINI